MQRSNWLVPAALAATSTLIVAWWSVGTRAAQDEIPKQAPARRPTPVVNIHELMELFNEPYYEFLKESMQQKPADNKGWNEIKDRGLQAAELVNLVVIREIGDEHRQTWDELNRTAQQAGLDLAHAAAAKDWEATQQAYRAVIKNCNDCHKVIAPEEAPQLEP